MARVFVTRQLPGPALSRLIEAHTVTVWPERLPPPPEVLRNHARESEGLLTLLTDQIDEAVFAGAPTLRTISNYAVGVDNVDLAAAARHTVSIGHTPDVLTEATADLAFALILAAARRLPEAIDAGRRDWVTWEPQGFLGLSVHGATLGLVGTGRIGSAVARRGAGFSMRVLSAGRDDPNGLARVLQEADIISLHCPLTPETRGLIDEAALAQMKPTAILVNTARGPIIETDALLAALRGGVIAGAALDVTDPEPLPPEHPLWMAPNLLVVPHIGSATVAARHRMTEIAVENLLAGLDGRPLPHPVALPETACA